MHIGVGALVLLVGRNMRLGSQGAWASPSSKLQFIFLVTLWSGGSYVGHKPYIASYSERWSVKQARLASLVSTHGT